MDIVLNSRHCELTDRFRSHVEEKLARLEKHDHRVIRVEVEVEKERNPRQADRAVRSSSPPSPRARWSGPRPPPRTRWPPSTSPWTRWPARCAAPPTAAGCTAAGTPPSRSRKALADVEPSPNGARQPTRRRRSTRPPRRADHRRSATARWWCGRRSTPPTPMTLDQALYEMELVGHDFFLFVDKETERPSVVYRRRGYDYGVITLERELSRRSTSGLAGQLRSSHRTWRRVP